jgi:hypothetical protein
MFCEQHTLTHNIHAFLPVTNVCYRRELCGLETAEEPKANIKVYMCIEEE